MTAEFGAASGELSASVGVGYADPEEPSAQDALYFSRHPGARRPGAPLAREDSWCQHQLDHAEHYQPRPAADTSSSRLGMRWDGTVS